MASTAELVTDSVADLAKGEEPPRTFRTMTMRERFAYVKEVITVEPLVAAYVLASVICTPALLNLEFEKACRSNLAYNDSVCDDILSNDNTNFTEEVKAIQGLVATMHSWQGPLQTVMPLLLILFLGSYSDRHKLRKPFLLIPIFGEFFAVAGCIVSVILMKEWSLEAHGVLQTVVPSFFGGQPMVIMATFAYIADVSTVEMRTLCIGVAQIVFTACLPIAQSVSGILFKQLGYIWVLAIGCGFFLFGFLYGLFVVKEPRQPAGHSRKSFLMDLFNPKDALETFNVLFKRKPGKNRIFILVILVIYFIYSFVNGGEGTVFYTYVGGNFGWRPLEYSYFITANTIVHLVGTLVGVPIFTKILHLSDLVILGITLLDKIVANIFFGVAKSSTMLYVAMIISVITGISPIAIRSMATKMVPQDDLGKAQSLFGVGEALGGAIAAFLYNLIFLHTLNVMPSAYFYVSVILYAICMLVVSLMYYWSRKSSRSPKQSPNANAANINMSMNGNGKAPEEYQTTHI